MMIEYYTNRNAPLWFWMGVGLFLFLTLCGIISDFFIETNFIIPIAWGLMGGYAVFYYALKPYRIRLSEKEIEYKTLFGMVKTFPVRSITFTEEYELQKDNTQLLILYLHFPKYRVKSYQDYTPQYDEILAYCKRKLQRVNEPNKKHRYFMPLWIIIGYIIVHFVFISYCDSQKLDGVVKITVPYHSHELDKRGKRGSWYELSIYLKEHPELKFGSWSIDSEDKDKIDSILRSQPHNFVFTISRDDYEKKIKKSVPMQFCDKYIDRNFVEVLDKLENIENKEGQKVFAEDKK